MLEIWLHTFALLGLIVVVAMQARKIAKLERRIDRIDRAAKPRSGPINETEWLPPTARHTDIRS